MKMQRAIGAVLLVAILAGCGGAGASASPSAKSSTAPAPTDVPGASGGGGSGGSGGGQTGGGSGGNTGGGVNSGGGAAPPPVPGDDGATIVLPQPSQLDPKPVNVNGLLVNVDGRHVTARISWYSGVEPCYVLDSVKTSQDGKTITITALEGHGPGDGVCIELAMLKATVVDLGDLEPGTYVIQAQPGDAAPVTIEVK
jgi:hypothetical protein